MKTRATWALVILLLTLTLSAILDLSWAPRPLSFSEVLDVLLGSGTWGNNIIVGRNSARIVAAMFIGAGLSVGGAVMQAVFRNPMASPYTLGLSSGACFGAAVGMLFSIPFIPPNISVPALAFMSCLTTMTIVYSLAHTGSGVRVETLLLAGIAVGAMFSALVSFLTFYSGDRIEGIVFWTMGSLGSITWESGQVYVLVPMVSLCVCVLAIYSRDLNAMMIGDAHAMDLGVDVRAVRIRVVLVTTVMVATSVAFVGSIGFVGLVVPHVFRILLGPDNRLLVPFSAIGGAAFMLLCDYTSHALVYVYGVLPIGIITSLIGAPYFIYLIRRRKREVGW